MTTPAFCDRPVPEAGYDDESWERHDSRLAALDAVLSGPLSTARQVEVLAGTMITVSWDVPLADADEVTALAVAAMLDAHSRGVPSGSIVVARSIGAWLFHLANVARHTGEADIPLTLAALRDAPDLDSPQQESAAWKLYLPALAHLHAPTFPLTDLQYAGAALDRGVPLAIAVTLLASRPQLDAGGGVRPPHLRTTDLFAVDRICARLNAQPRDVRVIAGGMARTWRADPLDLAAAAADVLARSRPSHRIAVPAIRPPAGMAR